MRIRSTENEHEFQTILYKRLNAYSLQGLLMDSNNKFTAAVEAIEYDDNEQIEIPFSNAEIRAKLLLASKLEIPFFIVIYKKGKYYVCQASHLLDGSFNELFSQNNALEEKEFAQWWGKMKGTTQTKPLANGAGPRAGYTVFDGALEKYGLMWGGNIDGFIVNESFDQIMCVIDNISVSSNIKGRWANPAIYFNDGNPKHGPNYSGWLPTTTLAMTLNVPHALFTFDKRNDSEEHVGLTFISNLSKERISFVGNVTPNSNVIDGLEEIVAKFTAALPAIHPPKIV